MSVIAKPMSPSVSMHKLFLTHRTACIPPGLGPFSSGQPLLSLLNRSADRTGVNVLPRAGSTELLSYQSPFTMLPAKEKGNDNSVNSTGCPVLSGSYTTHCTLHNI